MLLAQWEFRAALCNALQSGAIIASKITSRIQAINGIALATFQRVSQAGSTCIDFLVPPRCANCNQLIADKTGICATCWDDVRFIEQPYCPVMGTPFAVDLGEGTLSTEAIAYPPPFERLRSAVFYDDIARRLISRFKFSDRTDLAPFIADVMERAGRELIDDADIIVPLPLHWRRLLSRRFNQSAYLANLIAERNDIACLPLAMSRIKHTRQQIGLSLSARKANIAGAFVIPAKMRPIIKAQRVLLIDDVYTSGASVKAATKVLLRGGADKVDVLTFAKVHSGTI